MFPRWSYLQFLDKYYQTFPHRAPGYTTPAILFFMILTNIIKITFYSRFIVVGKIGKILIVIYFREVTEKKRKGGGES